ncbi:MAG TPA: MG2 domain-containing protein [Syntrophorhabdaceae bacterium]|nr:MG2 domain-containing protein [Syntrophorhabdaceae bacterium]
MKNTLRIFVFLIILIGCWGIVFAGEEISRGSAKIENFTPQGLVKNIRQVTVRFSEQIVPFGELNLPDPFVVNCPVQGKGRWLDGKNWVYDFDKDLEAGIICQFRLKDLIQSLKGNPVTGERSFSFSTGGPAVKTVFPPADTNTIEEQQVFILALDGPADELSIIKNAYFIVDGIKEPVEMEILKDHLRERILMTYHKNYYPDKEKYEMVVRPKRVFPNNTTIRLIWGRGIKTTTGVPTIKDQIFVFKTRRPFTATFECMRENPKAGCIPVLPMRIMFNAPVASSMARQIVIKDAKKTYRPKVDENKGFVEYVSFPGPFPEKTLFTVYLPKNIKDDGGRALINEKRFPLKVKTDAYPPLAKFSSRFGIIEKQDPVLPVTVRNIEAQVAGRTLEGGTGDIWVRMEKPNTDKLIIEWLNKAASAGRTRSILKGEKGTVSFALPKPSGQKAFEVMGIPLKKPGFYVVEIESNILGTSLIGKGKTMYCPTTALVTDMAAHFKWGRDSSLVWITSLSKGQPVEDVDVVVRNCEGRALWQGKTDRSGIAMIDKPLPRPDELPQCELKHDDDVHYDYQQLKPLSSINRGLFVFARKGDDMTFVHSGWDEGIEPYRFRLPYGMERSNIIAHTVFDRVLFRAGETVHMKHFLRRHTTAGMRFADDIVPRKLFIQHMGSREKYELPVKWDKAKSQGESTWEIPRDAKLGHYSVFLVLKDDDTETGDYMTGSGFKSGEFRVEEFRVPLMKAIIKPYTDKIVHRGDLELDLMVEYLSGGGAKGMPVKLRSQIQPRYVYFDEYEDISFANGKVKEGIKRRSGDEDMNQDNEDQEEEKPSIQLKTLELTLGEGGSARARIEDIPYTTMAKDLLVELEYNDPNGETQTVSRRIPVYPSHILLGIMTDTWGGEKQKVKFQVQAIDTSGRPQEGVAITSHIYKRDYYTHRKRLVGGFYSYEHVSEIRRIAQICKGTTDKRGMLLCEVSSPVTGSVIIEARAEDRQGNPSYARMDTWIAGKDDVWFDVSDTDRMDLIPEKKRYEPGEVATFQVRMPMREAHALVTVEREGIIDAFVTRVSGKDPVIKLPIKAVYAPNVFVSVMCLRGRVGDIKPTAMIDLGKPSYKLGITEVYVGWKANELHVDVKTDRDIYRVREKAVVKIKVRTIDGKTPPKGTEVAVAAVDEGLLEILDNRTWDILGRMMQKRGYDVRTSTAQMQVVGKRHYGLKALPHGGGGGRQITRELFNTLLFWDGRVTLDEKAEASITIPLNDSITGFVVVAVASGGQELFGTARTRFQTTQDIIISSGLPEMIRQGDRFKARFTVRNTTNESIGVEIHAGIKQTRSLGALPAISEKIGAGEAKEVGWHITAPEDTEKITWEVAVKDKKGVVLDSMRVTQRVVPVAPPRVIQSTLMRLERDLEMDVRVPQGAIPKKGGLSVSIRPRLSAETRAITEYMRQYPYSCLEQKVSKAVAISDEAMWNKVMAEVPSHLDANGLVKYFPRQFSGSDILTSYIIAIADEAGLKIPGSIETRMLQGLKNFVNGRFLDIQGLGTADISIRRLSAIEALSRKKMAEPSMVESIGIDPELWPTSAVIDWINILKRVSGIQNRDIRIREANQILRSRLNLQGTTMGFSTEKRDNLWWLMTGVDVNTIRTILTFLDEPQWRDDIPRLIRGMIARQRAGRWQTTTANAWGVVTLKKFSSRYEKEPITGITRITLDNAQNVLDWNRHKSGEGFLYQWQRHTANLHVAHSGSGYPWITVSSIASIPRKTEVSTGFKIKKSILPVEQKIKDILSPGDVMRIRLEIESQADMTWVVVSDPVPAGARIIKGGQSRGSNILTRDERDDNWVYPVFEEHSFEAFRAYYSFVPKGMWSVEYTIRLNNEGVFNLPETRVEALYAPEMFGEIPNKPLSINNAR